MYSTFDIYLKTNISKVKYVVSSMNYLLILVTFIAVNLDFFFILLFLLEHYRTRDVAIGYILGIVLLMTASFALGKALELFLPEWLLGILGLLPIYMAIHDNDEEPDKQGNRAPIMATFITYLAVCSGCNLSIFLPVLAGQSVTNFLLAVVFVIILSVVIVYLIKQVGSLTPVKRLMEKYGEILMKVVYIGVGLYVFYDSGLIAHLMKML